MQSNIQQYYPSFYTFYESHFFPGQTPVPPRSGTCIITHASRVDRKTTIKNAVPGYATRDGHMTWSRDGHMTKVPDCSKLKNKNIIKNNKEICCHIGYLFNLTYILTSDVKINLQIYWSNKRNLLSRSGELGWVTENQVQSKQWQTWSKSAETVIIWERMELKLKHNISQESVNLLSC